MSEPTIEMKKTRSLENAYKLIATPVQGMNLGDEKFEAQLLKDEEAVSSMDCKFFKEHFTYLRHVDGALEPEGLHTIPATPNTYVTRCDALHVKIGREKDGDIVNLDGKRIAEFVVTLVSYHYFNFGGWFAGVLGELWLQLPSILKDGGHYAYTWKHCGWKNGVHEWTSNYYRWLDMPIEVVELYDRLARQKEKEIPVETEITRKEVVVAEIPSSAPPNPGKRKRGIDVDLTKDSPISDEKSPPIKRVKVDEPSSSSKQQLFGVQYEPEVICQICQEVPPTTTVSCGHTVLCGDCSRKLAKDENPHTTKCVICNQLINFIYYNDVDMVVIPGQAPPIEKDVHVDELPVAPSSTSTSTSTSSSSANSSKSQMERDFDLIQAGQMSLIAFKDKYNLKYV
jgi:hypothetical protein